MTLPVRYGEHRPLYPGQACEVCAAVDRLVVDHCHAHGWVRGTLCLSCNTRMAFVDRMVAPLPGAVPLVELLAYLTRCPDCIAVTEDQIGATRSLRRINQVLGVRDGARMKPRREPSAGGCATGAGDDLMTRDEVAALLNIDLESVRSTMRRRGIPEVRGYPRAKVEASGRDRRRTGMDDIEVIPGVWLFHADWTGKPLWFWHCRVCGAGFEPPTDQEGAEEGARTHHHREGL